MHVSFFATVLHSNSYCNASYILCMRWHHRPWALWLLPHATFDLPPSQNRRPHPGWHSACAPPFMRAIPLFLTLSLALALDPAATKAQGMPSLCELQWWPSTTR
jgi:hypothetical protein